MFDAKLSWTKTQFAETSSKINFAEIFKKSQACIGLWSTGLFVEPVEVPMAASLFKCVFLVSFCATDV